MIVLPRVALLHGCPYVRRHVSPFSEQSRDEASETKTLWIGEEATSHGIKTAEIATRAAQTQNNPKDDDAVSYM